MGTYVFRRAVLAIGMVFAAVVVVSCGEATAPDVDDDDHKTGQPGDGATYRLDVVGGDLQVAVVTEELENPLVVQLLDEDDEPVAGVAVGWSVIGDGGTIKPNADVTDSDGKASATWTLGTKSGLLTAVAIVEDAVPANIQATAQPCEPMDLAISSGDQQEGEAGELLPLPVSVLVKDTFGNVVRGATVDWDVLPGGGSITPNRTYANDLGVASALWTIGRTAGTFTVTASLRDVATVEFAATSFISTGTGVCPARFLVRIGDVGQDRLTLPYCASRPIDVPDDNVERIVFSIHGISMNARSYLGHMVRAAEEIPGELDGTLIIAPQFMTESFIADKRVLDTDAHWSGTNAAFWGSQQSRSLQTAQPLMSSYEIMDSLLTALIRPEVFPNLEIIVVGGHSGGGQFANRYAATNGFENGAARAARGDVRIRYVVANPSSYVYLNDERKVWGEDRFAVPSPEAIAECPGFDSWGYGLAPNPWAYVNNVGVERVIEQYAERDVVYLMGEADNDPDAGDLAKGCQAMMQGSQRWERAQTYFKYIQHFYGDLLGNQHRFDSVPGVGHSASRMWNSPQGRRHFFDYPTRSDG